MRRLFAVVLAALMLFAGCSSHSGAQTPEVTEEPYVIRDLPETQSISIAESFAGGSGTETDPYQISNENQLALMAQKVAEDVTYASACYVLTGNISLNDTAAFAQWETEIPKNSWEPIGRTGNDFLGVFDGRGHTISGLYINTDSELTESYNDRNYGLFGTVAGVVKNLTVTESWIHVTGKSATGAYVGGVAGNVTDKGSIENCVSGVMVFECDANCGGITGGISGGLVIGKDYGENEKPTYAQVKDCGFEGTIIRKNPCNVSYMGGIAGVIYPTQNANMSISHVSANVKMKVTSSGNNHIGGIVGYINLKGIADFTNVCSYLQISQSGKGVYNVSPLIGSLNTENGSLNLSSCYLSLNSNDHEFNMTNSNGYTNKTRGCLGQLYGQFKGKSKFTNVFATVSVLNKDHSSHLELYPCSLTYFDALMVNNCSVVSVLPNTCGFEKSAWDLSDMSHPKLKDLIR
jgi:hypothetical protein